MEIPMGVENDKKCQEKSKTAAKLQNGCRIGFVFLAQVLFLNVLSFLVPFALYLQQFETRICHFAGYLLHLTMFAFHFAMYLLHLAMSAFHFAWYLPHFGTSTSHLHGICYILVLQTSLGFHLGFHLGFL
jgi:hypothetical protein